MTAEENLNVRHGPFGSCRAQWHRHWTVQRKACGWSRGPLAQCPSAERSGWSRPFGVCGYRVL